MDGNDVKKKQLENQRANLNNAKNIKVAANLASKSGHPYAAAIGKGVMLADKVSGGKASERLGKELTKANKRFGLAGRMLQNKLNKASEGGMTSGASSLFGKGKTNSTENNYSDLFSKESQLEEQTSDEGGSNFKLEIGILKKALYVLPFAMIILVFFGFLIPAYDALDGVIDLSNADSSQQTDIESKLEVSINTDNIYALNFNKNKKNYIIQRKQYAAKNFIVNIREKIQTDLSKLFDYYSSSKNYDKKISNNFFYKLHDIYTVYAIEGLQIDLPLLMSVLMVESTDTTEVFKTNAKNYEHIVDIEDDKYVDNEIRKSLSPSFDVSKYKISKKDSSHDIEILARNMFVKTGENTYVKRTDAEYREFLKEFIEKKYYSNNIFGETIELDKTNVKYEYSNIKNKDKINRTVSEIYDLKELYESMVGKYTTQEISYHNVSSSAFWWPIGSLETETINGKLFAKGNPSITSISSYFASQESFRTHPHGGIDIPGGGKVNYYNIIASKDGIVEEPTSKNETQYKDNPLNITEDEAMANMDGGGYGNYVKIRHYDGTFTIYAHLAQDSITVMAGDVVKQGQVIGKMGHSGSSTGPHLHFEVRTESTSVGRVNPLEYVSADDPRPTGVKEFSLTTTSLTKDEFVLKMNDYCKRTNNNAFCTNFASNAKSIYDASLKNEVNPEMVVVTAGTEQSWENCGTTNNFWGIGIANGESCSDGAHYASLADGIAGYANVLKEYQIGGEKASLIQQRYEERLKAGADPNGIGLPGTYAGMQMVYSNLGKHHYGGSDVGGYYYMDPARAGVTTIYSTHQEFMDKCYNVDGEHAEGQPVTAWEQSRYTMWQMEKKNNLRSTIFGI